MSRTPTNKGLAVLCQKAGLQIADLACLCKCSERAIHLYTTGRKHLPRVERALAAVFHLTVPALRRKLKLEATHGQHRRQKGPATHRV